MTNKAEPTKRQKAEPTKRQKAERARRIAMGIAVIQKPMKYIRARHKPGSSLIKAAQTEADKGNGYIVKRIARCIMDGRL